MNQLIEYKPRLDGLRALAILPVILYHIDERIIPAGYLGVDIFFILSGYLITLILTTEYRHGSLSFCGFWVRRLKRLFPALIAMTTIVVAVGAVVLIQPERESLPYQAVASVLSFNNIYLWMTTGGYWDTASDSLPLLHTWSLAVEEQFYFLYPFVLLFGFKFLKKKIAIILIFLAFISFSIYIYWSLYFPQAAFYLLPSRIWQMLLGAVLVFLVGSSLINFPKYIYLVVAIISLALLIVSFWNLNLFFVNPYRLFISIGAAGLIFSCEMDPKLNTFLATRPLVATGKLSYSLYLWHWPIIVFSYYFWVEMNLTLTMTLILGTALLSYHLIEVPFRKGRYPLRYALIHMSALLIITLVGYVAGIDDIPLARDFGNINSSESLTRGREYEAINHLRSNRPGNLFNEEHLDEKKPVVVLGSSHARVLCGPIQRLALKNRAPFVSLAVSGVGLVHDKPMVTRADAAVINGRRFESLSRIKPSVTVVAGMWSNEIRDTGFEKKFENKLLEIKRYSDYVVVVGQVPLTDLPEKYKNAFRKYLIAHKYSLQKSPIKASRSVENANLLIKNLVASIAKEDIEFVDPSPLFLTNTDEIKYMNGTDFLYSDFHHVNDMGARLIVDRLLRDKIINHLEGVLSN